MGQTIAAKFPIIVPWAKGTPNESTGQPTSVGGIEQVIDISNCINARITDRNDVVPIQIIDDDSHAANVAGASKIGFVGYDSSGQERQISGTVRYSGNGTGADGKLDIVFPGGIWNVAGGYTFYVFVEFTDGSRRTTNSLKFPIFGDQVLAFVGGENYKDDFQKKLDTLLALPDWETAKNQYDQYNQNLETVKTENSALKSAFDNKGVLLVHGNTDVGTDMTINSVPVSKILSSATGWGNTSNTVVLSSDVHNMFDNDQARIVTYETPGFNIIQYYGVVYVDHEIKGWAQQQIMQVPGSVPRGNAIVTSAFTHINGVICSIGINNGWLNIMPIGSASSAAGGTARFVINMLEISAKGSN